MKWWRRLTDWIVDWLDRPTESFDPHGWTDPKTGKDWAQK